MDIETIRARVSEILKDVDDFRKEDMIDNVLEELDEFSVQLEDLAEEDFDAQIYDEIIENIDEIRDTLNDRLDEIYAEEESYDDDDDYGDVDDDY